MEGLILSGRLIDVILVLIVLEAGALWVLRRRTGRGPQMGSLIAFLASGACLMIALKAALTGADWRMIAVALTGALIAHGADIALRFRAG